MIDLLVNVILCSMIVSTLWWSCLLKGFSTSVLSLVVLVVLLSLVKFHRSVDVNIDMTGPRIEMDEWMMQWINEWCNEWMNDAMDEWFNGWMNDAMDVNATFMW